MCGNLLFYYEFSKTQFIASLPLDVINYVSTFLRRNELRLYTNAG